MAGETWCQRLNGTDATFLYLEDEAAHMHVGGVFIYEGKPPTYREFTTYVASRLDQVPRYRQKLAFVPLGLGRPVWIDDPEFDIEYHARQGALPAPGGMEQLKRYAGRFFGQPLDRTKPMWELELVEGLSDDRFAVLSKTHHCVLDGIAGNSVIGAITDPDPDVPAPAGMPEWRPRPAPGRAALLASSLREQVARPLELARGAFRSGSEARTMMRDVVDGLKPLAVLAASGRAPASSLNQGLGPHRRYDLLSVDLATVKRIRASFGVTVNDVLLAIVAGALRRFLTRRGEALRHDLRVFVPVNARPSTDAQGELGNQVAAVYCPLPLTERDPVARLETISQSMNALKKGKAALAALSVARLGEFSIPPVAAPLARLEIAFRRFNLVVSNVPGFPTTRWILGRRLLSFHPLIPLARSTTLSVGLHSYGGMICFGLLADADRTHDLGVLARAIPEAMAELVEATRAPEVAARAAVAPRTAATAPPVDPRLPETPAPELVASAVPKGPEVSAR